MYPRILSKILPITATILLLFKMGLLSSRAFAVTVVPTATYSLSKTVQGYCSEGTLNVKPNSNQSVISIPEVGADFKNINGRAVKVSRPGYVAWVTTTFADGVLTQATSAIRQNDPSAPKYYQVDVQFNGNGNIETKYSEGDDEKSAGLKDHCAYARK